MPERIMCEVAYARPERQFVFSVTLPQESTALDALIEALRQGLRDQCPEISEDSAVLGVFGKVVPPEHRLRTGDRVEIYRPLAVDPRAARRARVKATR